MRANWNKKKKNYINVYKVVMEGCDVLIKHKQFRPSIYRSKNISYTLEEHVKYQQPPPGDQTSEFLV